jgi:hypothetical protein
MDAYQLVPPVLTYSRTGEGYFWLDDKEDKLSWRITHEVHHTTSSFLYFGSEGENGPAFIVIA